MQPSFDDPESLAFLRRRIVHLGIALSLVGVAGLLLRLVLATGFGFLQGYVDPSLLPNAIGVVLAVFVAAAGHFAPEKRLVLLAIEGIGVLCGGMAYIAMGAAIAPTNSPGLITLLALVLGFFTRAIYIPSTARRTISLGALLGVPLVWATYRNFALSPVSDDLLRLHVLVGYAGEGSSLENLALSEAVLTGIGWALAVLLCGAASQTLYGLRRRAANLERMGQYTLKDKLGEGGMGEVHRASHALLRRAAAIKLIRKDRAGATAIARFEQEVQRTAELEHPNSLTVYDYGHTPEGVFYYAMEYIDGATLGEVVEADGPLPARRVVHYLLQALGPLIEAHELGLIHRDIKPANLMVRRHEPRDRLTVLDFGLVMDLKQRQERSSQDNHITGTPQYLAPETIASPESVDARADLYALGAVGYYLLTGTPVFEANTVVEMCAHHLHSKPEAPSGRLGEALPEGLEALVLQCLEKDPSERPGSARELRQALRELPIEAWSEEDAALWWQSFGRAIEDARAAAKEGRSRRSGEANTLAIDLSAR